MTPGAFAGLLASALLTSEPLEVRVLQKEHPSRLTLTAAQVRCDDTALSSPLQLQALAGVVQTGTRTCKELEATGVTEVRAGEVVRAWPGSLRISADGTELRLINRVDVEAYLPSVVTAELQDAPLEAQKAQAIVSRTFALASRKRHVNQGYDLCDLAHCQAYRGSREVNAVSAKAVQQTAGQVLLSGGVALKPTWFHAACGGSTSSALEVFGVAGPVGVSDVSEGRARCAGAESFEWSWEVPAIDLRQAVTGREGDAFVPLKRDRSGRVVELLSFGRRFTGEQFSSVVGRQFGWLKLRSLNATATELEGTVTFRGHGTGHGVGLCQAGARAMAEKQASAASILKQYFPQAVIRPWE